MEPRVWCTVGLFNYLKEKNLVHSRILYLKEIEFVERHMEDFDC